MINITHSLNMAIRIHLVFFVSLCFLLPRGGLGLTFDDLVDKFHDLETKFEDMSDTVDQLTTENEDLRTRVKVLEELIRNRENTKIQPIEVSETKASPVYEIHDSVEQENLKGKKDYVYHKKRIVPPTTSPTGVIAFQAYLSRDSHGPLSAHHILKFDVIPLNRGSGYNEFDGIFIAPSSGTYVFTWSIMCEPHGRVTTELMKNAEVIGTRIADSASSLVWDFSTGISVTDVTQGDHLYVRLAVSSTGLVKSHPLSRTSFSGWLLG